MALIARLRKLIPFVAILGLAACGNQQQGSTFDQVLKTVANTVRSAPASEVTATRASLLASGFDQPLIIVALQEAGTRGGMLKTSVKNGITIWRSADGHSTAAFRDGVLGNTTGLSHDLYSAETKGTRAAISSGATTSYQRVYRHLNGEGVLEVLSFSCGIAPVGRETITVFDRAHATLRFDERCIAESPDAAGLVRDVKNTYWRDQSSGVIWKSRQWMSRQMGYMTVERVFN